MQTLPKTSKPQINNSSDSRSMTKHAIVSSFESNSPTGIVARSIGMSGLVGSIVVGGLATFSPTVLVMDEVTNYSMCLKIFGV